MRKLFVIGAIAAASLFATPAFAADVITANSTGPTGGWVYGSGNNYQPSNTLLLQSYGNELALRLHTPGNTAPASDSNGVYSFALGTPSISFDYDIGALNYGLTGPTLLTITNLLTGQHVSFDPTLVPDNTLSAPLGNGSFEIQNSEQTAFSFLSGLGYNPNVNDTYSFNLTTTFGTGGNPPASLTAYAQVGSGLTGAVPEPATWAMMLLGFGGIGFAMRRKRTAALATA